MGHQESTHPKRISRFRTLFLIPSPTVDDFVGRNQRSFAVTGQTSGGVGVRREESVAEVVVVTVVGEVAPVVVSLTEFLLLRLLDPLTCR